MPQSVILRSGGRRSVSRCARSITSATSACGTAGALSKPTKRASIKPESALGARTSNRPSCAQTNVWSSLTRPAPSAIICKASADLPAPDGPRISNPRPSMATQLACKRRSGPTGPVTPADPPQSEPRAVRTSGRHSWGECSRPRSPRHGPRQFASRSTGQGPNCCRNGWQADRNRTA